MILSYRVELEASLVYMRTTCLSPFSPPCPKELGGGEEKKRKRKNKHLKQNENFKYLITSKSVCGPHHILQSIMTFAYFQEITKYRLFGAILYDMKSEAYT